MAPSAPAESTIVYSPAGVRLVVGLVAPFLTPAGQQEVEAVWGAPAEVLFKEAVGLAAGVADHPVLHAALGVWTREHRLPEEAEVRLGEFLQTLPSDPARAQEVLDRWASEHTFEMIKTFPCQVNQTTRAVLASALAMEDTWARPTDQATLVFDGTRVPGFDTTTPDTGARATVDGRAVRVSLPLASGLVMNFAISEDGVTKAAALLAEPGAFTKPVCNGQPFVTKRTVAHKTTDVALILPEYTTRSTLDLASDAATWGLAEAMSPHGVPGLGDLEVSEAKQSAFIEVTHTGVRAAAVTALMLRAAACMPSPEEFSQRVVRFSEPFAYEIVLPGQSVPLFAGSYCG